MEKMRRSGSALPSFEAYLAAFQVRRATAENALSSAGLPELERFGLKVAFLLDEGLAPLPEGKVGHVVGALIAKLMNEVLAFSGAMRMGALHGSWHHARARRDGRRSDGPPFVRCGPGPDRQESRAVLRVRRDGTVVSSSTLGNRPRRGGAVL